MHKVARAWSIFREDGLAGVIGMTKLRILNPYYVRLYRRADKQTYDSIPFMETISSVSFRFVPEVPIDRRYTIVKVMRALNVIVQQDKAEVTIAWSDETISESVDQAVNGSCLDISKSTVALVFEQCFGYTLALDPRRFVGRCVEKADENAMHDGRVVECPRLPLQGKVYQTLINNQIGSYVEDIRVVVVGSEIVITYLKYRPMHVRFANINKRACVVKPAEVFSSVEMQRIIKFCDTIGLQFGELDVLRDQSTGLIYIVDVAKTPMGPPNVLPLKTKLEAIRVTAQAFRRSFLDGKS